ncbi:hypothetical protein L6452_16432 [Arctium lappa]|uniref:Uncharacterized protein n=1 Tax=Arctium lappa TaxID=4217 RepID=A0ACB9C0Y5_ARCLA|nr:hypothetical protein L6452_16432 [Arctium lappa]
MALDLFGLRCLTGIGNMPYSSFGSSGSWILMLVTYANLFSSLLLSTTMFFVTIATVNFSLWLRFWPWEIKGWFGQSFGSKSDANSSILVLQLLLLFLFFGLVIGVQENQNQLKILKLHGLDLRQWVCIGLCTKYAERARERMELFLESPHRPTTIDQEDKQCKVKKEAGRRYSAISMCKEAKTFKQSRHPIYPIFL